LNKVLKSRPGTKPLSVISICLDDESRARLWSAIELMTGFEFIGDFQFYLGEKQDVSLVQLLRDRAPDICILDFDKDRESAIRTAEQLHEAKGSEILIFAVSNRTDPDLIISAMRCGCSEYFTKPLQPERLVDTFMKFGMKKREKQGSQDKGRVLTFIGAKGGSGVTALAIHLATFLSRAHSLRTLLVDLHTDLGDAAVYLGFSKRYYHFYELVNNIHRLDRQLLEGFVQQHESGIDVLGSPDAFDAVTQSTVEAVEQTLEFLREIYDVVVVDCPPTLKGMNVGAIAKSEEIYLVATPEVPAIRNLARYLDHLNHFQCPSDKVHVIINRGSKRGSITEQQIEKVIHKRVYLTIPNSYAEIIEAINTGTPVTPAGKSELIRSFSRWAENVAHARQTPSSVEPKKQEARRTLGIFGL
jgi:pilus assembly protein CpaE